MREQSSMQRDSTRASDEELVSALEFRDSSSNTPPPKNRISEYENARTESPRKNYGGPLFEIIKSNRKPDDKTSPITNLPNG